MKRVRWDETNIRILRVIARWGGRHADVCRYVGCSKNASMWAARRFNVRFSSREAA